MENEKNNSIWEFCEKCNDYYLSKSFFVKSEIIENNDIDNKSSNKIKIIYESCPKGHLLEIDRIEIKNKCDI